MSIMKIFLLTTLIVSVIGGPIVKTWTLDELEKILHDKTYDAEQKPYLEEAYNLIIFSMFTNKHLDITSYSLPPPQGVSKWTTEEMEKAIKDPTTNPKFLPALHEYYEYWKNTRDFGDKPVESIEVHVRGMDISTWTLPELSEAIANPQTNSLLLPYLETARTKLTSDPDFQDKRTISIVTKIGLVKKDKNVEQSTLNQV